MYKIGKRALSLILYTKVRLSSVLDEAGISRLLWYAEPVQIIAAFHVTPIFYKELLG